MPLLLLVLHILAYQIVMLCSNAKPYMSLLKLFTVTSTAISFLSMFYFLSKVRVTDIFLPFLY